ncbi:hypothetical protein ANACOL_01235 [Anaerotruncus colihominis DSM 17241]|uniref:Uncharacterized protein n=1 Tax=Anaerotruncus colihominis DSM 17241 TaxID=445972 RepID=B0P8Y9_9FIRM|nr:hypothetical protein ANACOL_01235 [Anaerotruncus colihominis DSM 17241]
MDCPGAVLNPQAWKKYPVFHVQSIGWMDVPENTNRKRRDNHVYYQ